MPNETPRRDFLKSSSAAAAFTTSIFTGNLKGANDRINAGYIGLGKMGRSNLQYSMKQENLVPVAVCDIYQRNLDWALDISKQQAKPYKDFRELLADKSIDVVCISTPDHWHAYMTVAACKAGKDVYVEKPICTVVDEGPKMVQAARKYNRVVQAGTMQRSAKHFQKAVEIVKNGDLGKITFVRTWNYGLEKEEGYGNPPDGPAPETLNWDMWLGPAPAHAYNANRFGVDPKDRYFSTFRWFWDYAGGMMTDWGVHWLDIVQMAFNEEMPSEITAMGGKYFIKDNTETPDTMEVTYTYPSGWIATYERRAANGQSMFGKGGGILFCGTKGTMFVDRGGYQIVPERAMTRPPEPGQRPEFTPLMEPSEMKAEDSGNLNHWANFLECVKTRQKPISDIEICNRSTATCLLGNVALRSKLRLTFDQQKWTTEQAGAHPFLKREYRKPWKLEV
ncbi:MAG: Gfo/Idh/MocA family oxidoreductase [Acidobacteriaceae bacterium]|nr:Gfo/Idh/MocA family oxidoreductase [Acidobacteriaceae bacterium]